MAEQGSALAAEVPPAERAGKARLVLEAMRPREWLKNAFVLGGLMFSGQARNLEDLGTALLVLAAFCLASGSAYLFNDVRDAESDLLNPRTAGRPIARGALDKGTALAVAGGGALVSLGAVALVNWETLGTLGGFLALQALYSAWLKHVLFLDVMAIAALFVLRAYAGLVCIDVAISEWLLLCTALIALLLGFAKRRGEAVALGGTAQPQRPVLEQYSVRLIDELIMVVAPSTVVAYALYAVLGAETQLMLLTVPFVLYGIFRVLYLIHHRETVPEDPSVAVLHDGPLLACVVLWGLTAGVLSLAAT